MLLLNFSSNAFYFNLFDNLQGFLAVFVVRHIVTKIVIILDWSSVSSSGRDETDDEEYITTPEE